MNKILAGILLLTLAVILPQPLRAEVNISIGFALPEPVYFERPPGGHRSAGHPLCLRCSGERVRPVFLEWLVVAPMAGPLVPLALL